MTERTALTTEQEARAAELAFGLLEGVERLDAERERVLDPAFAAAVRDYETMGAGWLGDLPEEAAPTGTWDRIRRSVETEARGAPPSAPAAAASAAAPAVNDNAPGLWRGFAVAASLAAIVFAGLWVFNPRVEEVAVPVVAEAPLEPGMLSVAQINGAQADMLLTALYDSETGALYLRLADITDPARVPQLWLIGEEGVPRSLGFGQRGSVTRIELDPEFRQIVEGGGTIAVSLEEPAEQPHEAPSDVLGAAPISPFTT